LIDVECEMENTIRIQTSDGRWLTEAQIASAGIFQTTIADNRREYLLEFFQTVHAQEIRRLAVTSGSIVL